MPNFLSRTIVGAVLLIILAATLAACSQQPEPEPQPTTIPTAAPQVPTDAPPAPTSTPESTPTPEPPPTAAPAPTSASVSEPTPEPTAVVPAEPSEGTSGSAAFVLGEGTIARYKVEEELARQGYFVATGETSEVEGRIVFDEDGSIVASESVITMQAGTLVTDSDRRDRYVRERTLLTAQYPEIVFKPIAAEGLPSPLSEASGTVEFTISGDLTIRDQTRPVTWDVTAEFGDIIMGIAAIEITFEQFAMDKPSVAIVLSVEDTIRLEIAFVGSLEQAAAMNTGADNDDAEIDLADEARAQAQVDPDAPVPVVEFSTFQ